MKFTVGETVVSDDEHDDQMARDESDTQVDSRDGAITDSNLPEWHPKDGVVIESQRLRNGANVESQQLLNFDLTDGATVAPPELTTPDGVTIDDQRVLRSRARDGAGAALRQENRSACRKQ